VHSLDDDRSTEWAARATKLWASDDKGRRRQMRPVNNDLEFRSEVEIAPKIAMTLWPMNWTRYAKWPTDLCQNVVSVARIAPILLDRTAFHLLAATATIASHP